MRYCPLCEEKFAPDVLECPRDRVRTLRVRMGMEKYIGVVLDQRWRMERLIGEGGMGAVFEARQVNVDRSVAVKLIRGDFAREEVVVSRFYREARVMSGLQHPNIIKLLDFGQDEESGDLYMVMELLRGRPLADMLRDGEHLALEDVLTLTEQLAAALMVAHSRGVIHRDLKPDNLFIQRVSGRGLHLTLLDFGIARVDEGEVGRLTRTGAIQGTPTYMSPEQAQGDPVTSSVDLYAMGVILYEILTGREPFTGESLMQVLMAHITTPPPELAARWRMAEPLCDPLVRLVNRLLAKRPEDRPESALEVLHEAQAIRAHLQTGAPLAEPTAGFPILDTPLAQAPPPATPPPDPEGWSMETRAPSPLPERPAPARSGTPWALLIVLAALLLGGVAAAALFLLPPGADDTAAPPAADAPPHPDAPTSVAAPGSAPTAPERLQRAEPPVSAPLAAEDAPQEQPAAPSTRRRAIATRPEPPPSAATPPRSAPPVTAPPTSAAPRDRTLEDTLGKMRNP